MVILGNTLYGTAYGSGSSSNGIIFAVSTDGTYFATLHSFTATSGPSPATNSDGAIRIRAADLLLSDNILYGTAYQGGSSGSGTVFSLSILPQLTTISSGTNIILTWPTNFAGFTLQCKTDLFSAAVWTNAFPEPVVVNGQNVVTNGISGTQRFYRLKQ